MIALLSSRGSLATLNRATWILGGSVGGLILLLGIRILLDKHTVTKLSAESKLMESHLASAQPSSPAASHSPNGEPIHGLQALGVVQTNLTHFAHQNGCDLSEFRAGISVAPYSPRYRRELPEGDWSQSDAKFALSGSLRNILMTLRDLQKLDVPIEFDSINLSRNLVRADGTVDLSAQVQLRTISEGSAR